MKTSFASKNVAGAALAVLASAAFFPTMAQAQLAFNVGVVSLYKSSGNDQDDKQADEATAKKLPSGAPGRCGLRLRQRLLRRQLELHRQVRRRRRSGIDLYGGYGGEITKGLSYDLNLATYIYPGAADGYDGSEFAAKLSYSIASVKYVYGLGDYKDNNKWVLGLKVR